MKILSNSIQILSSSESRVAAAQWTEQMVDSREDLRVVYCHLSEVSPLPELLKQFVRCLADAAGLLWPLWYNEAVPFLETGSLSDWLVADRSTIQQLVQSQPQRNASWLKVALRSVRSGKSPFHPEFPLALQARQLGLALTAHELLIVVCVEESDPAANRLLGFARGIEWLVRETRAGVLVVLPTSLQSR